MHRTAAALNDFSNFWITHHVLGLFYIFLVLHPWPGVPWKPTLTNHGDAWLWVTPPVLIYGIFRFRQRFAAAKRTRVIHARILKQDPKAPVKEGDVLHLKMEKPKKWASRPGEYLFLQVPEVSRTEWHPFTISSCPQEEYIGLHIRFAGDWTGHLLQLIETRATERAAAAPRVPATPATAAVVTQGDAVDDAAADVEAGRALIDSVPWPRVVLDGPVGAPAQGYSRYKVLMLVGAGIGLTPFGAILGDLVHQMAAQRCDHCGKVNRRNLALKKIYMFVVVRHASEAVWFQEALEELVKDEHGGLVELHVHVTSAKAGGGDAQSSTSLLDVGRKLSQANSGVDLVTGMRTRPCHLGRPDWCAYFTNVEKAHPLAKVGVFYCGPQVIADELRAQARARSSHRGAHTHFSFTQEHF